MPAYIRLDMFPAVVTLEDGTTFDPCRAVVTDESLYVFVDGSPTPYLEFKAELYDYQPVSRTSYKVITDDEQATIYINKRAGCGCGNKLRGFRPFPGTPLARSS